MQHEVEMLVTEVHEYNVMPTMMMGGPGPSGMHQMLTSPPDDRQTQLLCIHMQKADKNPIEPDMPLETRMMLKGLQQAGMPLPNKMLHVVISPEEYDRMGRPRAHEKIKVTFEYER